MAKFAYNVFETLDLIFQEKHAGCSQGNSRQPAPLGTCAALPQFTPCPLERVESLWAPRHGGLQHPTQLNLQQAVLSPRDHPSLSELHGNDGEIAIIPQKLKKIKNKKILACTESDVALIWCSQSKLDGERPPLWSEVSTVSKYGTTTAQNRVKPVSILKLYDLIPNL